MLNARLYPDMFPFTRKVQIAADTASSGAARLAGRSNSTELKTKRSHGKLGAAAETCRAYRI
jgi:hypothetical protein